MLRSVLFIVLMAVWAQTATAQTAGVAFGGIQGDPTLPVDITSETLTVSQKDGTALFMGNVLVIQGQMRLSADTLQVQYNDDQTAIARLFATGNVLLVNATDAAAAQEAVYTIASGEVVMTGNVQLTQEQTTFTAQKMVVDLTTGFGTLEGGVTTSFIPKAKE